MNASLCLNSCHAATSHRLLPRAAKQALSSLTRKLSLPSSVSGPSYHWNAHHKLIRLYRATSSADDGGGGANEVQSSKLVALEYADLNLPNTTNEELGRVRTRQHVNPLSSSNRVQAQVPDWKDVYRDPTLPLMVDIGCGSGRFLTWLAKENHNSQNYLGLEIRQKLVKRAELWVKELALSNIHFLFANATVSFADMVVTYPGPLMLVSILCPDPHFKKRHHKRRVVQKPLVDSIIRNLAPGGKVFVQSDVLEVAIDMRNQFDAESNELVHVDEIDGSMSCDDEGWVLNNPMGIRTEREIHAELEGARIYRRLYQKRTPVNK